MAILESKNLLEYINSAISLETDIATQEHIIADYNSYAEQKKPRLNTKPEPERPILYAYDGPTGTANFVVALLLGGSILIAAIIACFTGYSFFGVIMLFSAAFVIFPCLSSGAEQKAALENHQRDMAGKQKAYERELATVKEYNKRNHDFYYDNIHDWNESYSKMNSTLNKSLSETNALLERFYASDIIYPKYRNLPALTSIYEYLITGRCEGLTGPHGAYNLYEDELRKDTVISQLNTVIENLEQIKQNQYMLYQQVKSIKENTTVIASELQQIKGYTVQIAQLTALNAYYAALNERNTRITMYYHL